jgi:hypothetical protein
VTKGTTRVVNEGAVSTGNDANNMES